MSALLVEVQASIYQRLSSDTALNNEVTGVFDYVPEGTQAPYVTIGNSVVVPYATKDIEGTEDTVTLHCWSEYLGKAEAKKILALMYQALKQPLTIQGGTLINLTIESMQVLDDPDGVTKHGVLNVTLTTKG